MNATNISRTSIKYQILSCVLYTITHLILQLRLELIIPISREKKLMLRGLEQNAPVVELPESKIHALYIISVFI